MLLSTKTSIRRIEHKGDPREHANIALDTSSRSNTNVPMRRDAALGFESSFDMPSEC